MRKEDLKFLRRNAKQFHNIHIFKLGSILTEKQFLITLKRF